MAISNPNIRTADGTGFLFISLKGQVSRFTPVLEDISTPGIDGQSWRKLARKAKPFELIGIVNTTTSKVKGQLDDLHTLGGTLVQLQDDYGDVYDNVVILEVAKVDQKPLTVFTGGINVNNIGKPVLLTVKFTMQFSDVPQ